MGDLLTYAETIGSWWFAAVTGGIMSADQLGEKLIPGWKKQADKIGITARVRGTVELIAFVSAIVWAGFSAWQSEHVIRLADERLIAKLKMPSVTRKEPPVNIRSGSKPASDVKGPEYHSDFLKKGEHTKPYTMAHNEPAPPNVVKPIAPSQPVLLPPPVIITSPDQPPQARHLTIEQQKVLLAQLSSLSSLVPGSQVWFVAFNPETYQYALELQNVLIRAGFKSDLGTGVPQAPDEMGLMILRWSNSSDSLISAVEVALERIGLHAKIVKREGNAPYAFVLFVGPQRL